MATIEQFDWLKAIENANESTESIEHLTKQISTSQDYALPMNIWFSLLVTEKSDDGIIKYILLGGCIAEMNKKDKPDLFLTTRKLLTWSIFGISQRSITLTMKARLLRLIKMWRNNNLFGHTWSLYMLAAFRGVPPEYFGLCDFYVNMNGIAGICNSRVLKEIVDPIEKNGTKLTEKEIQMTLANIKQEKKEQFEKLKLPTVPLNDSKVRNVFRQNYQSKSLQRKYT